MAAIRTLLNPLPELVKSSESDLEPSSVARISTHTFSSPYSARKKQKICKDAAVFVRGTIRGECRYPPHEFQDDILAAQHQQFEVYPMGEIADYPRHIPYNSEKKLFQEKTGRESLEVFQYRFKVPGDDVQYAMLWDYNIGLVRTTPLFKCTGHSKTTPAKMLNRNPGLREICHSITGGALVAQGYWIPYEAAKAVAATFCWSIRYALTPIFGTDFPALCIPPDSDKHGDMIIDPMITKRCTEEAKYYRSLEECSTSRASSAMPSPLTPDTPTHPHRIRQFRPKALKFDNSKYLSDMDSDDSYTLSATPEVGYRSLWTPANTPRSVPRLPSPQNLLSRKRPIGSPWSSNSSSPELSPKSRRIDIEGKTNGDNDSNDARVETLASVEDDVQVTASNDEKAAFLLMSLKLQTNNRDQNQSKKRRAST